MIQSIAIHEIILLKKQKQYYGYQYQTDGHVGTVISHITQSAAYHHIDDNTQYRKQQFILFIQFHHLSIISLTVVTSVFFISFSLYFMALLAIRLA